MNDHMAHLRYTAFRRDYLAWTALHHFLPVGLLRELCIAIVDEISSEAVRLGDLFEEEMSDGPIHLQSWIIRPRAVSSPLEEYLQSRIRLLAWTSDTPVGSHTEINDLAGGRPAMFDAAIQLGRIDTGTLPDLHDANFPQSDSAWALVLAIRALETDTVGEGGTNGVIGRLASLDPPLNAVAVKHVGDLCADADRWQEALSLYRNCEGLLREERRAEWRSFAEVLDTIVRQSEAAALSVVEGPDAAASLLRRHLAKADAGNYSFLAANASHDALVASASAGDLGTLWADRRAAVCLSPLLLHAHDDSSALASWARRRFTDASRQFWAALRRQIALGSASDARVTKLHFSRNIFDELAASLGRHFHPSWFELAVRLCLESGQAEAAEGLKWERALVRRYVTDEVVARAVAHAQAHTGAELERASVAVEVFRGWIDALPADQTGIAGAMLRFIASQATADRISPYGRDLARRSLEVLSALARKRPEFRREFSSDIVDMIIPWIGGPGPWPHRAEALQVASEYLQVLPEQDLLRVVNGVLEALRDLQPEVDFWPVVRPALALLVSPEIKDLAGRSPSIGRQVIEVILRFGLAQRSERTRVFFYLNDFDAQQLADPQIAGQLADLVPEIRVRARQVNASDCIDNIIALLLAPTIAGPQGIADALESLVKVLRSTTEPRASIAFPHAYRAILLLSDRRAQIADATSADPAALPAQVQPLLDELVLTWRRAPTNPSIFAPFSLPRRNTPHPAVVQNWAYASEQLARAFGGEDRLRAAMEVAATSEDLRVPIGLARELGEASDSRLSMDAGAIAAEDEEVFYAALGQRLLVLRGMTDDEAKVLLDAFVSRCLALGPHGADLAVFSTALERGLRINQGRPDRQDYLRRLAAHQQLSLAIWPMLQALAKDR